MAVTKTDTSSSIGQVTTVLITDLEAAAAARNTRNRSISSSITVSDSLISSPLRTPPRPLVAIAHQALGETLRLVFPSINVAALINSWPAAAVDGDTQLPV